MSAPLSVSNSNIKVANAALAEIGVGGISSFSQNSLAARTANALYADAVEYVLGSYPWRFARDRVQLVRLSETPPPPWSGLYRLPTEALAVHSVLEGEQRTVFDVFGRKIAVMVPGDAPTEVWAEITNTVGPDQWPGYFRRAFITYLAGVFSMPITQDEKITILKKEEAATMLARAQSRDAQGRTPSRINTKGFIHARRSGGRRW